MKPETLVALLEQRLIDTSLTASAVSERHDDIRSVMAALHRTFTVLDSQPKTQENVDAMSLLADAVGEQKTALSRPPKRPPLNGRPSIGNRLSPLAITASARSGDGESLPDREALVAKAVRAFTEVQSAKPGFVKNIARLTWEYPEDRQVGEDSARSTAVMNGLISREALAASGGVCGPVNVDYSMINFSSADRPVANGLPGFQATRGGLRYWNSPSFAQVGSSGTMIWTEAIDAGAPGNSITKPVQVYGCPTEELVYCNAVPTRVTIGNMVGRFSPEAVAQYCDLALSNAARVAETSLLTTIVANSITVSSGQLLGASRDLLATLDQACAAWRYRARADRTTPMTAVFPQWTIDLFRADLTREIGNANDSSVQMRLSDADVDSLLTSRGVTPIWTMDPISSTSGSGPIPYAFQGWGAQTANAPLLDWPHTVPWLLFGTGSVVFLDGGRLDIAVVRDSTLTNTNDYQMFVEPFENVFYRGGPEILQIVSTIRPNGSSAGTQSTTAY